MKRRICDELSLPLFRIIKPFHCVRESLIVAKLIMYRKFRSEFPVINRVSDIFLFNLEYKRNW